MFFKRTCYKYNWLWKKENSTISKKELKSQEDAKVCYICQKIFSKKLARDKNHCEVRDYWHYTGKYRGTTHSICKSRFNVPRETPVAFHNGSNYDYHFMIKELAKESEGKFECFGENAEKYKTFSVLIQKRSYKI